MVENPSGTRRRSTRRGNSVGFCAAAEGAWVFSGVSGFEPQLCSPVEGQAIGWERGKHYHIPRTRTLIEQALELEQRALQTELDLIYFGIRSARCKPISPLEDGPLDGGMSKADLAARLAATQPKPRQIEAGKCRGLSSLPSMSVSTRW